MCVHDQTSPPDDHSAWKKKTQLAFDPEREKAEGETATQSKLIALCSVIDEQLVIWYTWTVDSLILKKKNSQQYMNNAFISYKNSTDSGCM